jgi:RNA polymerase sigma factor
MRTDVQDSIQLRPEDLIDHLRSGKEDAREILIRTYWDFILAAAARMTGRRSDTSDEFSVALQAFNEAIDCYDRAKNPSFMSFAGLVINRRLIGHFRKNRRYQSEYTFTSLTSDDDESPEFGSSAIPLSEAYEIQEELLLYQNALREYGITLDTLQHSAPKHADTRALCVRIAQKLYEDETLSGVLMAEKRLPIAQLLGCFSLSRKTIENNRKYIIALFLILNSELEIMKGYISTTAKGGKRA